MPNKPAAGSARPGVTRTCKLLFIPIFLLQAGFFWFVSQHRFIDGDEGFYLLASRLVMQHKIPYLDFFFTQAPLLPYVFALWFKLVGTSWFSARVFSALLTAILGGLMYTFVCRETGRWVAGLSAVLLFTSSSLVFSWFPIVKTFALATLFLFLTYFILTRLATSPSGWLTALAGVFFGLSVDTRSYVVGIAPVFLWWLWREDGGRRTPRLLWFLGGFLVGIAPSLGLFFASPDAYLFNNLGYHALRSGSGLVGDWRNKAHIVRLLFAGSHTGLQFSILFASCTAGLILVRPIRRAAWLLAFLIVLSLGLISLLPTPASLQYFSMVMPFLIVATVCLVSGFLVGLRSPRAIHMIGAACVLLLAGFVGFALLSFRGFLFTGRDLPGFVTPDAPNWTLEQVTAVSNAIDQLAEPGQPVASFWPGYIFASWADPYPGFENNFGMYVAHELSPDKRRQYHVVFDPEIDAAFARHGPRIAVVGNQGILSGGPEKLPCIRMLHGYGYRLARMVGDTSIYECCVNPR